MAFGDGMILLTWVQVMGALGFMYGFFRIQQDVSYGPLDEEALRATLRQDFCILHRCRSERMLPLVGPVVLIVIDALRADFVYTNDELLPLEPALVNDRELPKLARHDDALPCVAHLTAPTVTLPKIKTITTGAKTGMGDFIKNFFAASFKGDSLIAQWQRANRNLTMFGDDTWLRTFPGAFSRSEGTHSFFVVDFHEVDDNITRHIEQEMSASDWDVSILHYLGLDHVGHVQGPRGPMIRPKLVEMDRVIAQIKRLLFKNHQNPLIVVMGDHGMSDDRGHGGSSAPETSTPVLFLSPKAYSQQTPISINQEDIAPTLALLTGVPIPAGSIGMVIHDVIKHLVPEESDFSAFYNAHHLASLYNATFRVHPCKGYDDFLRAKKLFYDKSASLAEIVSLLESASQKMSSTLQENAPRFQIQMVVSSMVLLANIALAWFNYINGYEYDNMTLLLIGCSIGWIFSFTSTSFIEEEHQIVYIIAMTSLTYLLYQTKSKAVPVAMSLLALGRRWNNTGDKWRNLPDIADFLTENQPQLAFFHLSSMVIIFQIRFQQNLIAKKSTVLLGLASIFIHIHKSNVGATLPLMDFWPLDKMSVIPARAVYVLAFVNMCCGNLIDGMLMIWMLLAQPQNVPVIMIALLCELAIISCLKNHSDVTIALMYYILGWCTYYHMGNSNSPATIDLDAGYNGLTEFHPIIVPILINFNLYCGPILWMSLYKSRHGTLEGLHAVCFLRAAKFLCIMAVTAGLQNHLFILTVFSPKVLYEANSSLVFAVIFTFFYLFDS